MSKWIKKWSDDKNTYNEDEIEPNDDIHILKKKMRKMRKKHDNPKNIPIFEDIYNPPQSSNIIEGMKGKDLENNKDKNIDNKKIGTVIKDKLKLGPIKERWTNVLQGKTYTDPIADLENKLSDSVDNLSSIGDLTALGDSIKDLGDIKGLKETGDNMKELFKIDLKEIQKVIEEVGTSAKTLSMVFANVFKQLAERVHQFKIYIQLFILKINKHIDTLLMNMSNALTQDTATKKEIDVFKGQAKQFTTMMLVWYFVYNWYYIIFFLEKEDNMLMTFNTNNLKKTNTYLYGAFGPACRVVEKFNQCILSFGWLKNNKYYKVPTAVIMILLFFVFFILVSSDFQTTIITTFFDSIRGKFSVSLLSMISVLIVVYYSGEWFFGSKFKLNDNGVLYDTGNIEMTKMMEDRDFWSILFFLVLLILAAIGYFLWTVAINVPLSMFFISSYLAIYTFFGIAFYEGIDAGSVITGITNSIDIIEPDFTPDGCTPKDVRMGTWVWFKGLFPRGMDFLIEIVNYSAVNMFEILIFLMLLGGIGLYKKEWESAIVGKVGMDTSGGILSPNGIKNIFKQLFVWLVIINVLLLIILGIFLYQKFKTMRALKESTGSVGQTAATDQTMRSLMASKNPNMRSSDTKLNSHALDRIKKVRESRATSNRGEEGGAGGNVGTKEGEKVGAGGNVGEKVGAGGNVGTKEGEKVGAGGNVGAGETEETKVEVAIPDAAVNV